MLKQSISDSDGLPHIKGIESIATNSMSAKKVKLLHVLLVTETWLPEVNGVAMSLGQLMHQLNLKGHQISLLRPKPNHSSALCNSSESYFQVMQDISHDLQVKGVSIPKYKELQFGAPVYFKIKKHFQQLQPDVVHIATEGPLGLAALWAAKTLNITVTTGYHTQFHDFSRHFGLGILARPMMAYFKWFHNTSQATCVPSQKTFQDLYTLGFKRLYEVGRGVDLERFNPIHRSEALRAKWGAHSQHTVLLMVSRLSPEKGVDLVIKSFKALQQEQLHRVVKLVIVGDGPDKERLESLAVGNKEDIVFAGAQTGKDLSEHYASADVFVFASQVETFGNVVVEAMASGLPVYAFDDAAAGMLVTAKSGVLIRFGDEKAFVEKVARLPKMQVLKEQGVEASNSVAGFSWQRPAEQMLTMFYDSIYQTQLSD